MNPGRCPGFIGWYERRLWRRRKCDSMETNRPRVAIIDWSKQPAGEPSAAIERVVIGDAAEVRTYFCDSDSDFDEEILESSVLIIWHNIPITGEGIRRLK